jgi:hypothetical protein
MSLFRRDARKYPSCGMTLKNDIARKRRIQCAPEAATSPEC